MTTDATVQAASSTQISNENNQNQVNVTRPMTPEEEAEKWQVTFEVFFLESYLNWNEWVQHFSKVLKWIGCIECKNAIFL